MVKREITIRLQENDFVVKFPNVEQIINIEVAKVNYSQNQYGGLVGTMSHSAIAALDLIDSIATFSTLIPALKDSINISSLLQLDPIDAQELVVQYKQVFFPWYNELLEAIKVKEAELTKLYAQPETKTDTAKSE